MTLLSFKREGEEVARSAEEPHQDYVPENECLVDPEINARIETIVNWLMSQVEHVFENRFYGGIAKKELEKFWIILKNG